MTRTRAECPHCTNWQVLVRWSPTGVLLLCQNYPTCSYREFVTRDSLEG